MTPELEELREVYNRLKEWYRVSAGLTVTRSFNSQRYQMQLQNLQLDRQEALKPRMMLTYRTEFKHALRQVRAYGMACNAAFPAPQTNPPTNTTTPNAISTGAPARVRALFVPARHRSAGAVLRSSPCSFP